MAALGLKTALFASGTVAVGSGGPVLQRSGERLQSTFTGAGSLRRAVNAIAPIAVEKHRSQPSRIQAVLTVPPPPGVAGDEVVEEELLPPEGDPGRGLQGAIIRAERTFNVLCTRLVVSLLDNIYAGEDRDYARFYVLETIARIPYFSYLSVLHTYESFGWWRRADYLKVHFAESWNEMHHLLIMEALGGDKRWIDRFLAQHIAFGYFLFSSTVYIISPRMAYHFNECVEKHAYHTYDKFIKAKGEKLKMLPAPEVAVHYYTQENLYMFDEFQTSRPVESRRPVIDNLYDVFVAIREDEAEHCKTMRACQTPGALLSPHSDTPPIVPFCSIQEKVCRDSPALCNGLLECAVNASSASDRQDRYSAQFQIPEEGVEKKQS